MKILDIDQILYKKAKFEYSPLGELFNTGLDKNEKREGLLKRLKNIEDKTNNQLRAIECQKDRQLALVKKSNQPRIDNVYREKMKSTELK